jgi:excisionase family DNA binding protein
MTNDAPLDALLNVSECARSARVDQSTVRRWIRVGELDAIKVGPHRMSPVRVPFGA